MQRSAFIDTTKAVASQLIVLHHLSLYPPMADWLTQAWPQAMALLAEHGRLAVQPFLVIGGWLAAQSLARHGTTSVAEAVWRRYCRLMPQLAIALVLVVLATGLAGAHLAEMDWVSPLPSPKVLLAHLLLLQDVLGIPSVSAGAWYVAIDLQLMALLLVLVRVAAHADRRHRPTLQFGLVAVLTWASLLVLSHQEALDAWGFYFFGSYGLGVLAGWAQRHRAARPWWWTSVALTVLDAAWAPRERPLVALATAALLLWLAHRPWAVNGGQWGRAVRRLSDLSYSVFVCHFAVIVLASGLWQRLALSGLASAVAATAATWASCLAVGTGVQALVDRDWRARPRLAFGSPNTRPH